MSAHLRIQGGTVLVGGELIDAAVDIEPGFIIAVGSEMGPGRSLDARGPFVLPGIVDIHGDAFERQLMPRPGVNFPLAIALKDSDRQAIGNGITTVFHGVTASWEPGLRSMETARAIVQELERARPELAADTRLHLRYETYNLEAATEIADWIAMRRIDMLGFNNHLPGKNGPPRVRKIEQMAERAGLSPQDFIRLVERLKARGEEVPQAIARLAMVAREHGVPSLSHDDMRPDQRQWFRALHCRIAEFPTTVETAEHAIGSGDDVVLGAPNVVRGGSHVGWIDATDMIKRGLCTGWLRTTTTLPLCSLPSDLRPNKSRRSAGPGVTCRKDLRAPLC